MILSLNLVASSQIFSNFFNVSFHASVSFFQNTSLHVAMLINFLLYYLLPQNSNDFLLYQSCVVCLFADACESLTILVQILLFLLCLQTQQHMQMLLNAENRRQLKNFVIFKITSEQARSTRSVFSLNSIAICADFFTLSGFKSFETA